MKDTIFISHATPEDNEFTIWLASRLELLGYKVWIDKKELLGGEVFWDDIEDAIKNKAIKVLLVYSKNILDKNDSSKLKTGIQKEIDFATQVLSSNPELKDFLILLHLDDSPFNLFDGANDLNQISFESNWAEGLEFLLKKFQKDSVPESNNEVKNSFSEWYLEHYIIKNPIIEKKELYYTNWWTIDRIPEKFYIFKYDNAVQAKAIYDANKNILAIRPSNCIISFEQNFISEIILENESVTIEPAETYEIKISDLLLGLNRESFPTQREAENYFKNLLRRVLHILFRNNKLNWFEFANKHLAYYHTVDSLPSSKVNFSYPYKPSTTKPKLKSLYGKHFDNKWHFAISLKPMLAPFLGFNVKSHIVFTTDGLKTLDDKELIHSLRRKKGKRMFNEEWRDLLLAFISSLKDKNNQISIKVSSTENLILKNNVELFWSDFGYLDPKDLTRQSILSNEREDEEIEEKTV